MIKPIFLNIKIKAPQFKLELSNYNLTETEIRALRHLVHKTFFIKLLDFCLDELGETEKKEKLLQTLHSSHKDKEKIALDFLNKHIKDFHFKLEKESLKIDLELAELVKTNF